MAQGSIGPFRPTSSVSLTATTSSAVVQLAGGGESVAVSNAGSTLAYVRFGSDSATVATAADMPILANNQVVLAANSLISHAAGMTATGTALLIFTRGDGSIL